MDKWIKRKARQYTRLTRTTPLPDTNRDDQSDEEIDHREEQSDREIDKDDREEQSDREKQSDIEIDEDDREAQYNEADY